MNSAVALVLLLTMTPAAAPGPKVYYAAPDGRSAACSRPHPCSLEGARDKARQALTEGMDRDIEIRLTGGVYRRSEPLVLDRRDSGPEGHTVTWTAAPGARPSPVEQLERDLARAGSASQSATDGTAVAANAIDGSTVTDSRTTSGQGSWWQVDLGQEVAVGTVELWNDASMTTADVQVLVSRTPDFADATVVQPAGKVLRPSLVTVNAEGRYVRVQRIGTGRIGLSGVAVQEKDGK
ncbi:discoidin domain-containing protein [Nonomuraea candida]|uniref:discoidin domain-containing protein n=1 Tax=Nonomuraea candida TaxID=359159 RepID=UPI0005BD8984|nr:discoidin domain-containing protein [Nonomuraea candida]